jgi:arsenite methyltransferase
MREENIRRVVREGYAEVARSKNSCCGTVNLRDDNASNVGKGISRRIGYSEEDIDSVPEGADLGLGCGNPVALAFLKEGETVLDLGSGAGFDCFLGAKRVGRSGRVIGVDMTPEMIGKARENARRSRYQNVEFRLGEIENLPVADDTIDVVISNCVINLSSDKKRVFEEAFRVLRPGGRLMISDIVLLRELPESVRKGAQAYVDCISGAIMKDEYLKLMKEAGFQKIVVEENCFPIENMANDPTGQAIMKNSEIPREKAKKMLDSIASVKVSGLKPRNP